MCKTPQNGSERIAYNLEWKTERQTRQPLGHAAIIPSLSSAPPVVGNGIASKCRSNAIRRVRSDPDDDPAEARDCPLPEEFGRPAGFERVFHASLRRSGGNVRRGCATCTAFACHRR